MVNEQKILTIVLIIITLLLVPLYYYSSSSFSSITGRVTAEPATSTPQKVGEYSIKGDFTIDLNQNFDDYKTMRTNARLMLDGVLNCEQDKQISLEDCIKEVNTSLNLEWSTSCEDEKIAYFYEIVESYMQCANSNDNYCFCEFPINFNEEIEDFELTFQERNAGTLLKLDEFHLESHYKDFVPYKKKLEPLRTRIKNFFFSPSDSNTQVEPIISLENKIVDAEEFDNGEEFSLFKIDNALVIMTEDEKEEVIDENKDNDYLDVHECKIPNRRKYKFCKDSNMKSFSRENDDAYGKLDTIQYKFALDFSDEIPPTQSQTITLSNIDSQKESLMLEWSLSPDKDVDYYNIYFSTSQIVAIDLLTPLTFVASSDTSFEIKHYLEKGLKHKIEDGKEYYATVIPVDNSNNYMRSEINTAYGISSDDISIII